MRRALVCALLAAALPAGADEVPRDLVVDVRIVEARTESPNYPAMNELSFFLSTDGTAVSERQWLATIARNVPEAFLATLLATSAEVDGGHARLDLDKRARRFALDLDLTAFTVEGAFPATLRGELLRGGESQRSFERAIELELGRTHVFSGEGLTLTGSEYVSHFRDFEDRDQRAELYQRLREYQSFLVVLVTLRLAGNGNPEPVALALPNDADLPRLSSPLGVELQGTLVLELALDAEGAPESVRVIRSSIPEVNPRILGAVGSWRFPDAAGRTGELVLELEARP